MNELQRIEYINNRLKELIEESKLVSETKKKFLKVGYRLFVEEKKKLLKTPADQLKIGS